MSIWSSFSFLLRASLSPSTRFRAPTAYIQIKPTFSFSSSILEAWVSMASTNIETMSLKFIISKWVGLTFEELVAFVPDVVCFLELLRIQHSDGIVLVKSDRHCHFLSHFKYLNIGLCIWLFSSINVSGMISLVEFDLFFNFSQYSHHHFITIRQRCDLHCHWQWHWPTYRFPDSCW